MIPHLLYDIDTRTHEDIPYEILNNEKKYKKFSNMHKYEKNIPCNVNDLIYLIIFNTIYV